MTIRPKRSFAALVVSMGALALLAPASYSQTAPSAPPLLNPDKASVSVDPHTKELDIKAVTSGDLKQAIGYAVQNGDLDASDGKELIDKITDIETLMDQFDFIRDQERTMMSSVGSSFH
ncbi:MAG TPA: hypothetical protein V6D22_01845 [Candidatus Obscuribacterales bacterium]